MSASPRNDYEAFVTAISGSSGFKAWERANPKEYAAWVAYDAVTAATSSQVADPTPCVTMFARALVAAAHLYLDSLPAASPPPETAPASDPPPVPPAPTPTPNTPLPGFGVGVGTIRWGGSYDPAQIANYAKLDVLSADLNATRAGTDLPQVRTLYYRSACSINQGYDTSIPYATATANGLVLKGAAGEPVINQGYPSNVIGDISNPLFSSLLAQDCLSACRAYGFKGVFIDDVVAYALELLNTLPAGWTAEMWLDNMVAHVARFCAPIKAAGLEVVLNASGFGDPAYTGSDDGSDDSNAEKAFWQQLAPSITGLMAEYWLQNPATDTQVRIDGTNWNQYGQQWRELHTYTRDTLGVDFFGNCDDTAADDAVCTYVRAVFLLDYDGGKSVCLAANKSDNPLGVWTTAPGEAQGPATESPSGVWTRAFENLTVTVDMNAGTASIVPKAAG